MLRNLATLLIGLPALWLSIQIFGWIVSGDIHAAGFSVKREESAVRFWLAIVLLAAGCCALLGLALAAFVGALF